MVIRIFYLNWYDQLILCTFKKLYLVYYTWNKIPLILPYCVNFILLLFLARSAALSAISLPIIPTCDVW